jgi:ferredoxin-NADP reductase
LAFSRFRKIPRNKESDLITALILALILTPAHDFGDYLILAAAGALAMLSKYLLVYGKRHIFNPAALGVFTVAQLFDYHPSWWVGTVALTPLVFVAGQLILRKMKRYLMVSAFMVVYLGYLIANFMLKDQSGQLFHIVWLGLTATPVLFFVYIMLTEPSTSPHKLSQAMPYAMLVAALYSVARLHTAPEGALLIGNVLAFAMSPSRRLELALVNRKQEAKDIYSYIFGGKKNLSFRPGQYLEWTLPIAKTDSRGNRRYFTISSSPTEDNLVFTVKQPTPRSSFKTGLDHLKQGDKILAYQLEGSFVLPKDKNQRLAFIAGGIGVTPFRSITKYLIDSKQNRDIVLLYSANNAREFAFTNLFDKAKEAGVAAYYAVSANPPANWDISGPYGFVTSVRESLLKMGLPESKIVTDYFPGYG